MSALSLLGLPAETRLLIYDYFFGSSTATVQTSLPNVDDQDPSLASLSNSSSSTTAASSIHVNKSGAVSGCVSLLLTCRTIHFEAKKAFLAKTMFLVQREAQFWSSCRGFPLSALEASHITIGNSNQHLLMAFRHLVLRQGRKIPNLTLLADLNGSFRLLSTYAGSLAPCCAEKLTVVCKFDGMKPQLVFEATDKRRPSPYDLSRMVVATFIQGESGRNWKSDMDNWRCSSLCIFAPSDADVSGLIHKIGHWSVTRPWMLTAEVEVYLTSDWPYQSCKAQLKQVDDTTSNAKTIRWREEWMHGYELVSDRVATDV